MCFKQVSHLAIVGLHNAGGYNERDPASFNRGIRISYALRRLGLDAEIVADVKKEESVVVVVPPKPIGPKPASDHRVAIAISALFAAALGAATWAPAIRDWYGSSVRNDGIGFRVARDLNGGL